MPEKEKIPDYGHNMLQEEEIEFLTNICPHKVDESSERTEPPPRLAIPQSHDLSNFSWNALADYER